MPTAPQNYKNHARLFPLYHFFALPVLLVNVFVVATGVWRAPSLAAFWGLVVALALAALGLAARVMALTVQDRVIRLEMRHRLKDLCPPDLQARAAGLTRQQLVALRFAGDSELPALVREVLDGKLTSQKDIKSQVKDWQSDFLRA